MHNVKNELANNISMNYNVIIFFKDGGNMILSKMAEEVKPSSTLAITAKAKQMKAEGIDIVGFGAGEPDFDTPEHIKAAAKAAIDSGFTKYTPASGILELKKAIIKKLKDENGLSYETNQIVVSNGAKHSLTNTFMAILNEGDEVIIPAPFWLSYLQMVKIAGGIPVIVKTTKEEEYKITVARLKNALTNKTKAIIINSPSNPTGMIYTKDELKMIADFAIENDLLVISDEIYEKLIYDSVDQVSIASFSDEIYKRTIVINGVSKSYSMTGWRIGYTASSPEIARLMANIQSHASSNPNSIAQKAALAAISGPQDCVEEMRAEFDNRRIFMVNRLKDIPYVTAVTPKGAFYVFIDVTGTFGKSCGEKVINNADDFAECILTKDNVAVVPCTDFGYDTHIRLSYAISLENIKKGMDRIEKFVKELK